jgi:hypothetical protein
MRESKVTVEQGIGSIVELLAPGTGFIMDEFSRLNLDK